MIKKISACVVACIFAVGVAGTSYAAKLKCEVTAVEGDKVTMTCEDADKLTAGQKVKVSVSKKGAIEGC